MGLSSSKTKTQSTSTATPYTPATPAINAGIDSAQSVFNQNQPILAQNAALAQQAYQQLAPTAFQPSPYVMQAQNTAQNIASGAYAGNNPGSSTYSAIQGSTNPALGTLQQIANGQGAGSSTLNSIAGGSYNNPADAYSRSVTSGQYLNNQPSASLYSNIMDRSYLTGNPYLDQQVAQTNADVSKAANQRFAASGMGSGLSSAFADVLTKNLANSENTLRYTDYNNAANRQLTAAGQSDAAFNSERNRMQDSNSLLSGNYNTGQANQLSAAQGLASNQLAGANGLGSQYSQQQQNQLAAAQAADGSKNTGISQMLAAAGLAPSLANAQYAGVDPALSLLQASSTIPYAGLNAYAGALGSLAGQYGTTNSTGTSTTSGLPQMLNAIGSAGQGIGSLAAFSDVRLKRDVAQIGSLPDGLGVYTYRYLWDEEPQTGVMAHEVAELRPWALGPEVGGYMTVNYGAL